MQVRLQRPFASWQITKAHDNALELSSPQAEQSVEKVMEKASLGSEEKAPKAPKEKKEKPPKEKKEKKPPGESAGGKKERQLKITDVTIKHGCTDLPMKTVYGFLQLCGACIFSEQMQPDARADSDTRTLTHTHTHAHTHTHINTHAHIHTL